jgi:hypothetical protein
MGLLALGLVPATASSAPRGPGPAIVDRAEDCDPATPAVYNLNRTGPEVVLQILVLLDGVARPEALAIVEAAADSYTPLGVTFRPTYKKVPPVAPAAPPVADPAALIAGARAGLGGARPSGIDVVYLMTTKDLVMGETDVVGYADCIGGVRFPNRAFATGEAVIGTQAIGPLTFYIDAAAKTMAHEIGHLLGARHEHANCAQGVQISDATGGDPTPCTVMINYVDVQSPNFGALEASVVRAYAEVFADS